MCRFCSCFVNLYVPIEDNSPVGLRIYHNDSCFSSARRADDSCSSHSPSSSSSSSAVLLIVTSFLPLISSEIIPEVVGFVNTLALSAKGCPLTLILNAFVHPKGALLT